MACVFGLVRFLGLKMRYTGDDSKTLRQLLGESLRAIEVELSLIRESLDAMTKKLDSTNFGDDLTNYQLATLAESLHDLELRITALEKHASWELWLFRQIVFLACVGACVWALQVLA